MTCCAPGAEAALMLQKPDNPSADEILHASRNMEDGLMQTDLSVPSAHCGSCIAAIEGTLSHLEGVVSARLNLSTRRVTVKWRRGGQVPQFLRALSDIGYQSSLFSYEHEESDVELTRLIQATAVAGFAAMNIMLLSVSVWAGADGTTRLAFHFVSAILAIPAVACSGQIFFRSAWAAVRSGTTNMDVPISLGILLALALSIHDTLQNAPHAYFDATATLIFFLLGGRTLDHVMRRKARNAVLGLAKMMPHGARVIAPDGTSTYKPRAEIEVDDLIMVAAGERIPLDGTVEVGSADVDAALVTGEASPIAVTPGSQTLSGMMNLNGSLQIRITKTAGDSFIASMMEMVEAAEHARARYRRTADRAAALYSPVVHGVAALSFFGWIFATGDWHRSLSVAICVLIITCPCALGLAVPMVQVMAARRLFERGIALKEGSALERLAEVDTVVFDKTGTLTVGELRVTKCNVAGEDLSAAAALAASSRHPVSRAVAEFAGERSQIKIEEFKEWPGYGVEGRGGRDYYRLGRSDWAQRRQLNASERDLCSGTVLAKNGDFVGSFEFSDTLRPRAREVIKMLQNRSLAVTMISGDRREAVSNVAALLGIDAFHAEFFPEDKAAWLEERRRQGQRVLMVGDGLNDAPALSAALVSMAPASAADVGRGAADLVYFGSGLMAIPETLTIARVANRLVRQNLLFAVSYNVLVIPIAISGHVTPFIAALAMSLSSMLVVANALRFPRIKRPMAGPAKENISTQPFLGKVL